MNHVHSPSGVGTSVINERAANFGHARVVTKPAGPSAEPRSRAFSQRARDSGSGPTKRNSEKSCLRWNLGRVSGEALESSLPVSGPFTRVRFTRHISPGAGRPPVQLRSDHGI